MGGRPRGGSLGYSRLVSLQEVPAHPWSILPSLSLDPRTSLQYTTVQSPSGCSLWPSLPLTPHAGLSKDELHLLTVCNASVLVLGQVGHGDREAAAPAVSGQEHAGRQALTWGSTSHHRLLQWGCRDSQRPPRAWAALAQQPGGSADGPRAVCTDLELTPAPGAPHLGQRRQRAADAALLPLAPPPQPAPASGK